jgi:hypothetical protein
MRVIICELWSQFLATVARRRFTEYAESSISTLSCDVLCWFVGPMGASPISEKSIVSGVQLSSVALGSGTGTRRKGHRVAVTQLCVSFSRFQKALRREKMTAMAILQPHVHLRDGQDNSLE